jgi:glycosyltransferase involved in cell wall biosynthesis
MVDNLLTSLVITTYNRAALLSKALESVAQSQIDDPSRVEVIVVDNNSSDHTRQMVDEIKRRGFPFRLRYVLEQRQGLSYARNRGTDESSARYVAFMDDDQLIDKDYLSRLPLAFQSTRATCVGGPIFYYNKNDLPRWLPPLLEGVGQCDYGDQVKILRSNDGKLFGGNMAFERQGLVDVGKYDVSLGRCGGSLLAGEEHELQARLHATGKRIAYHPSLIQYHYLSPARLTKRYWRRYYFGHGRTLYRTRMLKAGADKGPFVFGIPRWLLLHLLIRDIAEAAWSLKSFNADEVFEKQLAICTRLGQIHEARQQFIGEKAR